MRAATYFSLSVLILHCSIPGSCFIQVSGIYAGVAALGSIIYTGFDSFVCHFKTCCDDRWIIKNLTGLEADLQRKLHGQHLVQKTVLGHIKGHLRTNNPSKALVLSFHGPTGVGKNFVSRIIAENLYREGLHSKFVHLISATKEFPHEGMVPFYKERLKAWIEGNVTECERSLFIFDEVDKLPTLLLDVIKPYLDYYEHLGGVNYRRAIFLFLSNTGGADIGQIMFEHWQAGKRRETLELSHVENNIMKAAINADNHNGFWHSQLISTHLITAYIPFLPLGKEHVRKCIRDGLLNKNYFKEAWKIPQDLIDLIVKELTFFPAVEQVFSSTGCKRVSEKIDLVMADYKYSKRLEL
ncbi:Torsin-1A [Biomphalaria glabrata]|uniref:Torsin-1A-like n=2 Tax=Biomphalaria glabrata TaxID=6526 RepID=A0A9W3B297_BIOGL|nr:torsin-1A-like [Biomphalaria glabrata]XP_055893591.1 torsin-1A-like [Biomphalaria glabrata]XP_055893593.1 torsin-1A-like [Biomphalaria glabrata]XP_055893594.1 torsin-1A-like [Biomphalaria glabrata]KAI8733969.1 torsin-1A-like [Biomphalaria glabrata]